jgi:hypothetical protein
MRRLKPLALGRGRAYSFSPLACLLSFYNEKKQAMPAPAKENYSCVSTVPNFVMTTALPRIFTAEV